MQCTFQTFSGAAEFPDRSWAASFLCSPLHAYLQNFLFRLKNISQWLQERQFCAWMSSTTFHSRHCPMRSSTQPGDSTSLPGDGLIAPHINVFLLISLSLTTPSPPCQRKGCHRGCRIPIKPSSTSAPGLTTNWKVAQIECFCLASREFFF